MSDTDASLHQDRTPDGSGPLDRALASALQGPELPADFHASLMAQIALERATEREAQRVALAGEHERQLRDLRRGYLNLRQDTLLTVVAGAFTCGAAAAVGLPALAQWTGIDMLSLGMWISGGLALAAAVTAVRQNTRLLG